MAMLAIIFVPRCLAYTTLPRGGSENSAREPVVCALLIYICTAWLVTRRRRRVNHLNLNACHYWTTLDGTSASFHRSYSTRIVPVERRRVHRLQHHNPPGALWVNPIVQHVWSGSLLQY